MSAAVVAFGAISALGEGSDAAAAGELGAPAKVAIAHDEALARAGFVRPLAARVRGAVAQAEGDRAANLLVRALAQCADALDERMPDWRARRVGLALGTSSGGMLAAEKLFTALANGERIDAKLAHDATYFGPLGGALAALGLDAVAPATLVLTACAASTIAIGLGARWLAADRCDLVLAGGFDVVSDFVAAGFEVLRATTGTVPPRPFAQGRDGMSLGEGAAVVALVRPADAPRALAFVEGFGASADAVHLTAPDRTGSGLARAAEAALRDAGAAGSEVDVVSGHATATPFNDPAECEAIRRALGIAADAAPSKPVLHAFKAQIGHTLGAAGVLESLACISAIERSLLPATPITAALEPNLPGRVLPVAESARVECALKLSAAFGGANAALVIRKHARPGRAARPRRDVFVGPAVHVTSAPSAAELATRLGVVPEKLARTDALVRMALGACADLVARFGPLPGAGVIVGHALATFETNASFYARVRERGPRAAEPRKFPYTSPNAVAGECSTAFGWTGPGVAVGVGLHGALDALGVAADLVRAGDADTLVVLAVDEVGAASQAWQATALGRTDALAEGAVALVVSSAPAGRGWARVARIASGLRAPNPEAARDVVAGHRALLPLATDALAAPVAIAVTCPSGAWAEVALEPVNI